MNQREVGVIPAGKTDIVLWGPPQSGKRWLLWSFARELETYNQNHPDFRHELFVQYPGDSRLIPIRIELPTNTPQGQLRDFSWIFRRFPLVADRAHQVSAYMHNMRISVIPGEEGIGCLFNPAIYEASTAMLTQARNVIAVLDPCRRTMVDNGFDEASDQKNIAQKERWSQEEYLVVVHALLEWLWTKNTPPPTVAFCITKLDQVNEHGTPWDLVKQLFGQQMFQLLQYYRPLLSIEVSAASAHGVSSKQDLPAFQKGNDWNTWKPINAVAPFFHLFQEVEKAALHQHSRPSNILGFILNRQDEKYYIPYQLAPWQSEQAKESN